MSLFNKILGKKEQGIKKNEEIKKEEPTVLPVVKKIQLQRFHQKNLLKKMQK